ncbi:MAG: hypothetical protein R2815_05940 [Flavobacteriales bacterium]
MRPITALIALFLLCGAQAQITITEADMPSAGDTMRYRNTAAQDVDIMLTGPGVIWDMSGLPVQTEGADTAVTVGSTPLLYQFFFNNAILYPEYDADYAMKGVAFGFQQLQVEDVYDYYKKDTDGFRNVGFGATINGLPASVRRQPVDRIHAFPMDFQDTDASFSTFQLDVPNVLFFRQEQLRENEVDGWGTLYLPADTFEVLRVRSVLQKHDSIFVEQFGLGFGFDEPETVEYKWIAAGMDAPVLRVTTTGGVATSARFFYDPGVVPLSVGDMPFRKPGAFPIPASGMISFNIPQGGADAVIVDASGAVVRELGHVPGGLLQVDVSDLPEGVYVMRALQGTQDGSVRFVVQH